MKETKTAAPAREPKTGSFARTYTQNEKGFYVRNVKPSSGTLNDKRLENNLRSLLEKATSRD